MDPINDGALSEKGRVVLDAATRIYLEHGFSGTTTDMIQKESGVSKSTMYNVFPTKELLFAAVIQEQCNVMARAIEKIALKQQRVEPALTALGAEYLRILLSPQGLALYRMVVAEAVRFPDLARHFYLTGPRVAISLVASRLSQAARESQLDLSSVGIESAASLYVSMVRGEAHMEVLAHPHSSVSQAQIDHWVGVATRAFLLAFGVPSMSKEVTPH